MKPHPEIKKILAEMEKWAKKKTWRQKNPARAQVFLRLHLKAWRKFGSGSIFKDCNWYIFSKFPDPTKPIWDVKPSKVIHFIPMGCHNWEPFYTYCARPGVGKVIKHKIGNCPLAKEAKE